MKEKFLEFWYEVKDRWYQFKDEWNEKDSKDRNRIIVIISLIIAAIAIAIIALFSFNKTKIAAVADKEEEVQLIDSVSEQVQTVSQIVADNNETVNQNLDQINEYLDSLDVMISDYQKELTEITKILKGDVTEIDETSEVNVDLETVEGQIKDIREEIAALKASMEKGNSEIQVILKNSTKDNTEVLKAITTAQTTITSDTNTKFEKINTLVSTLDTQMKTTESDLTKLISAVEAQVKNVDNDVKKTESEVKDIAKDVIETQGEVSSIKNDLNADYEDVMQRLNSMKDSISKANEFSLTELEKSIGMLQSDYKNYTELLNDTIEKQFAMLTTNMNNGFSNMNNTILGVNTSVNGKIDSVNDSLSNKYTGVMSNIDSKYDLISLALSAFTGRFDSIDKTLANIDDKYVSIDGSMTDLSTKIDVLLNQYEQADDEGKAYIIKVIVDKGGEVVDENNDGAYSYAEIGAGIIDLYNKAYAEGFAAGEKDVNTLVTCHVHTTGGGETTVVMPASEYKSWKASLDMTEGYDSEQGCFTNRVKKEVECSNATLNKGIVKDNGDGTYMIFYTCNDCGFMDSKLTTDPDNADDTVETTHVVDVTSIYTPACGYTQGQIIDVETKITDANKN